MKNREVSRQESVVVALIATHCTPSRDKLLRERAIPSILAQTRRPDLLLIVCDASKKDLPKASLKKLKQDIQEQCGGSIKVGVLRNRRTKNSASGAWNSGIDELHRDRSIMRCPGQCFIAILDDDDAWEVDHIEACLRVVAEQSANMVVSGIIRHNKSDDEGHRQTIPVSLDAREQFIRGQHIQGSNLFVALDMLLKSGCFDEHLPSCTDRDLCIRLADLPGLKFGATMRHTVHHYADDRKDRLSAPYSRLKLDGLTRFWLKHAERFDESARKDAAKRAYELFGWKLPELKCETVSLSPLTCGERKLSLVVGIVTDATAPKHANGLLEDLKRLAQQPDIGTLTVVLVENGPIPTRSNRPLHELAMKYRAQGLTIELVSIEQQEADWKEGKLIDTPNPATQRLPIALTRTILNTYVVRIAERHPGAAAWILDDDKRLSVDVDTGKGVVNRRSPDVAALLALRDSGVDVVIGADTGAAPLPFTATLRVQLIDLKHFLDRLENSQPSDAWKDQSAINTLAIAGMKDCYYDLSRNTEHLETPLRLNPSHDKATLADAIQKVGSGAQRLLAGEEVFRPLTLRLENFAIEEAKDSVQRGGSTIFFRPEHLRAYPHNIARIGEQYVRRSDMLITQLMRDQMGLKIVMHASAGVHHDRTFTEKTKFEDKTLREDVLGYALYRTANELMRDRTKEEQREPLLAWTDAELSKAKRLVVKYIKERLAAITLCAWRIHGLADAIRHTARRLLESASDWSKSPARENLSEIAKEMDEIYEEFSPSKVEKFADEIRKSVTKNDIRNAFSSMDGLISEYHATFDKPADNNSQFVVERERRARKLLSRYGLGANLRLLGVGGEGIVFTDEESVFKVFDLLKRRPDHDTKDTLLDLSNRLEEAKHLYALARVEERDGTLIVMYPFEPSEPYMGGHGVKLLGLLRECKANGVVCRNIHPKNLRVTAKGLKLIDYGSDIRPYSEAGYRSMAERAWLTWRWPSHENLDGLMRRALTDKTLPELDGFERFWKALNDEHPSATRIVSSIIDPIVLSSEAKSVLDYGCGKKARTARRLAAAGLRSIGYDPGVGMPDKWQALGALSSNLTLTTDRVKALQSGPFDAVVSSLVICEMGDGPEYEKMLADIRSAVRPEGIVVISLCNPLATFGRPTNLHRRRDIPPWATYEDSFWYVENAETDTGRKEFHRPLFKLERDLLRNGLRVERCIASETIDVERFEPASDFLTLVCRPVERPDGLPSVSLLIKTCAMEAATIERQIHHLVSQLERPRVFIERVLVIDSRSDGFIRQYTSADLEELKSAAERLRKRGLIDRVLYGPQPGESARRVIQDWFALDCEKTHTKAGAPLVAPLWAMEQCEGDYILQVDSDILIRREDFSHDYLAEMIAAIDREPKVVTASLSVPQTQEAPFTKGEAEPWRVEVRGCLLHKARLLGARPYFNKLDEGIPVLSWHRSLDLAANEGRIASLRGASTGTAFVHPPNEFKRSVAEWMLMIDLIEKYPVPASQVGKVDLTGGPLLWTPRNRTEPFIFVITGRNVPAGRVAKCLESITKQNREDWGAVIVDDGSCLLHRESLRMAIEPWRDRITLIQPCERRGQMANMTLAIRHVCTNPKSVIITLDLDDSLIGADVLERLEKEYADGADVTVGSMLRTDKKADYPAVLQDPRRSRGGNVWQHLRTFHKALFDDIPDQYLRVGDGYVDIAVDWAFMLPIVEMAHHPVWIREPLYLYEPSGLGKGPDRLARESQIAAIMAKPPLRPKQAGELVGPLDPLTLSESIWGTVGGILFLRHGERPRFAGLSHDEKDAVELTERGFRDAFALGQRLGKNLRVITSPVKRAVQTANAIVTAAGTHQEPQMTDSLLNFRMADVDAYNAVKNRLGWAGLMEAWMDGSLAEGTLIPCHQVAFAALRGALSAGDSASPSRIVAVTHDFVIMALLATLRGQRITAVPYLGGVFVEPGEYALIELMENNIYE
jgi:broad specificity phosphatase PhoE/glycosyltransferase involved in cell wall biosynthesis/SAM-dependent methyltransferase